MNGIPVVFIELKAVHHRLQNAYDHNLRDYKDTIPHLFWHNGLIILSNGSESRVGSVTAEWDHFTEWKRINSEGEEGVVSLETVIRGTCEKENLLDLLENFTVFTEVRGGLVKLVAKNHQYLGVNNTIEAVRQLGENQGRLGVFWHTQGSGRHLDSYAFQRYGLPFGQERKAAGRSLDQPTLLEALVVGADPPYGATKSLTDRVSSLAD